MALLTITIIAKIAYILLRLTFGVGNGPADYSKISEPIMDLTNNILQDETWNPENLHNPLQAEFDAPTYRYDENIPFGQASELDVDVYFHPAVADSYIDDIITLMLMDEDWVNWGQNVALLAVHTLFRPATGADPLPRPDTTSIEKLRGEGTPDELKTVLGCNINTRTFIIYLPSDKATEWTRELRSILKSGQFITKKLESTIGQLNHAGYIIPQSRYFLNRLRNLLKRCKQYGPQKIGFKEGKDISFWIRLLNNVGTKGVDINNITLLQVTDTTFLDVCDTGMGDFSTNGIAWHYSLPQ